MPTSPCRSIPSYRVLDHQFSTPGGGPTSEDLKKSTASSKPTTTSQNKSSITTTVPFSKGAVVEEAQHLSWSERVSVYDPREHILCEGGYLRPPPCSSAADDGTKSTTSKFHHWDRKQGHDFCIPAGIVADQPHGCVKITPRDVTAVLQESEISPEDWEFYTDISFLNGAWRSDKQTYGIRAGEIANMPLSSYRQRLVYSGVQRALVRLVRYRPETGRWLIVAHARAKPGQAFLVWHSGVEQSPVAPIARTAAIGFWEKVESPADIRSLARLYNAFTKQDFEYTRSKSSAAVVHPGHPHRTPWWTQHHPNATSTTSKSTTASAAPSSGGGGPVGTGSGNTANTTDGHMTAGSSGGGGGADQAQQHLMYQQASEFYAKTAAADMNLHTGTSTQTNNMMNEHQQHQQFHHEAAEMLTKGGAPGLGTTAQHQQHEVLALAPPKPPPGAGMSIYGNMLLATGAGAGGPAVTDHLHQLHHLHGSAAPPPPSDGRGAPAFSDPALNSYYHHYSHVHHQQAASAAAQQQQQQQQHPTTAVPGYHDTNYSMQYHEHPLHANTSFPPYQHQHAEGLGGGDPRGPLTSTSWSQQQHDHYNMDTPAAGTLTWSQHHHQHHQHQQQLVSAAAWQAPQQLPATTPAAAQFFHSDQHQSPSSSVEIMTAGSQHLHPPSTSSSQHHPPVGGPATTAFAASANTVSAPEESSIKTTWGHSSNAAPPFHQHPGPSSSGVTSSVGGGVDQTGGGAGGSSASGASSSTTAPEQHANRISSSSSAKGSKNASTGGGALQGGKEIRMKGSKFSFRSERNFEAGGGAGGAGKEGQGGGRGGAVGSATNGSTSKGGTSTSTASGINSSSLFGVTAPSTSSTTLNKQAMTEMIPKVMGKGGKKNAPNHKILELKQKERIMPAWRREQEQQGIEDTIKWPEWKDFAPEDRNREPSYKLPGPDPEMQALLKRSISKKRVARTISVPDKEEVKSILTSHDQDSKVVNHDPTCVEVSETKTSIGVDQVGDPDDQARDQKGLQHLINEGTKEEVSSRVLSDSVSSTVAGVSSADEEVQPPKIYQ